MFLSFGLKLPDGLFWTEITTVKVIGATRGCGESLFSFAMETASYSKQPEPIRPGGIGSGNWTSAPIGFAFLFRQGNHW